MASDDTEFNALAKIVKELTPLDQAARDRVLTYAVARFASPVAVAQLTREANG
jgi:hypothetical protein